MKLFSAFGAADLLEKDRQTVRRALRHAPPDGHERKQPRWRLPTILAALEEHFAGKNTPAGDVPAHLARLFVEFDRRDAELRELPTIEARRTAARSLMVLLIEQDRALAAHAQRIGIDAELQTYRREQLIRLALRGFEAPCGWSYEQTWEAFNAIVGDNNAPSKPRAKAKRAS